jgi:hypothetical protein
MIITVRLSVILSVIIKVNAMQWDAGHGRGKLFAEKSLEEFFIINLPVMISISLFE